MTGLPIIVAAVNILTGLAFWGTTYAAARGRLKLNSWSGIRTSETMASPAAWQTAHIAALPWATIALCVGLVAAVITGVLVLNGASNRWAMIVACAGLVAITVVALLMLCVAVETVRG